MSHPVFRTMLKNGLNLVKNPKHYVLSFRRSKQNSPFPINVYGIKLLSCLRLNFGHLNKHKFQLNLKDAIAQCSAGV